MSTSIRLPPAIQQRIAAVAGARDTTPHAFMLAAIEEKLQAEEAHAQFVAEAARRLKRMKKANRGIPAAEVFDYLLERANGKAARRPRGRKLP